MNKIVEEDKKSLQNDIYEMVKFLSILFAIGIFLFLVKLFITKKNISWNLIPWIRNRLSYFYIISFGLLSGILVFFGIESFDNLFNRYLPNMAITNLTSVTIVIGFCFIYSALLKEILEILFKKEIILNVWENVIGYWLVRGLIIVVLYFIVSKNQKKNKV